jgi:hypothetical protein
LIPFLRDKGMVNITHEELAETKAQPLPDPSLEALKSMREEMCSITASRDFKLQSNQRFLRRVMSPESPTRNILLVHGTGVGKTCTAIQIAEEYIIRPEFQDKRVLVLANPAIQENFKSQIFNISKVSIDADGILLSKQCTGRRYLDMLQRSQSEPLRYSDKASQSRIMSLASKIISEFYEFQGYAEFSNTIVNKEKDVSNNQLNDWIHKTFDNRLIIVDEAHNLRETTESDSSKLVAIAIERILKVANGVVFVLLTATPMYDKYDELLYYFNLFLWNDRVLKPTESVKPSDIFDEKGNFKEGQESRFRGWCQEYISYVKGENPFTFPFRLPPPEEFIALPDRETDIYGKPITTQRKFLTLTRSFVSPLQSAAIKGLTVKATIDPHLLCVYPNNTSFRESFDRTADGFAYKTEKFLAPSTISQYSSKFGLIMNILNFTTGIAFVYSNLVESGAQLFAMCLEEHGFEPAVGSKLLKETSGEIPRNSKGKYILFTSEVSDADIRKSLIRIKNRDNADGSDVRVIIASPKVSEGVDFQFVRQIHVLDPWFNMSRIEQVLGRGMRTCSHSLLPFEEQNCTVYLHVCRYPDSTQETLDEYIYRTFAEEKAVRIAKVKRIVMESAMDCQLQENINSLPIAWRDDLRIPQIRSQDRKKLLLTIGQMSAPTFEELYKELKCNVKESEVDPTHIRPLSAVLDVREEVLDKLLKLIVKKPIWKKSDLYSTSLFKQYSPNVLDYILQNAIDTGFQLKDKNGRIGRLQSRDGIFAFTMEDNDTMLDRLLVQDVGKHAKLKVKEVVKEEEAPKEETRESIDMDEINESYEWPEYVNETFSDEAKIWYLVDKVIKPDDKITHILELDWDDPPVYATPLIAQKPGRNLYILGSKKIYNTAKELITPIGEDEDLYREWLEKAKTRFVTKKTELFATLKEKVLLFNVDEKSKDEIKRAIRNKVIGGRACTNFTAPVLNMFSNWLVDDDFPDKVKTKEDRCMYLDLLIRQAIIDEKEGLFWVTPEEYQIFEEDANRADLLKRLKD